MRVLSEISITHTEESATIITDNEGPTFYFGSDFVIDNRWSFKVILHGEQVYTLSGADIQSRTEGTLSGPRDYLLAGIMLFFIDYMRKNL